MNLHVSAFVFPFRNLLGQNRWVQPQRGQANILIPCETQEAHLVPQLTPQPKEPQGLFELLKQCHLRWRCLHEAVSHEPRPRVDLHDAGSQSDPGHCQWCAAQIQQYSHPPAHMYIFAFKGFHLELQLPPKCPLCGLMPQSCALGQGHGGGAARQVINGSRQL